MICLKIAWNRTWEKFGTTSEWMNVALPLLQITATIFFLALVDPNISNKITESLDYLGRIFLALNWSVCAVKHIVASITAHIKSSSVIRRSTKAGAEHLEKYRCVLDEKTNAQSTNRGFRTIQDSVCTYKQTKRGFSYFHPKRIVPNDGIHTKPLLL